MKLKTYLKEVLRYEGNDERNKIYEVHTNPVGYGTGFSTCKSGVCEFHNIVGIRINELLIRKK